MDKNILKKISSKQIDNEKLKSILLYMLAFFIPLSILIGIFIILKVYPFGENNYLPVDAYGQYIAFLQYFKEIFLGNESIFYSLSKSLGGGMYGLFAYYLMSPYNFITLLFSKGNIPFAFEIIMVLKTATCGVTFMYYLNRRKKAKLSNLIFSTMYSLSAYVITYGFNIMWLDSVILLPLVIAGIEDIIKHKRFLLYTISLILTLITNYYMGFMICVFSAIYFIYFLLMGKIKPVKNVSNKIILFAFCSICAVLITGIILIPVFVELQNGRAEFTLSKLDFEKNFELTNLISKFFTNSFNIDEIQNEAMPPLFCGVFANLLVMLYFLNNKIKLKEKILSLIVLAIFIVSFYINGLNVLWTIGNQPAWYKYRYAFMFTFMYILMARKRI